jgi:hypothetical protein
MKCVPAVKRYQTPFSFWQNTCIKDTKNLIILEFRVSYRIYLKCTIDISQQHNKKARKICPSRPYLIQFTE